MINELAKRQRLGIFRVTAYARNDIKIDILEDGYESYLEQVVALTGQSDVTKLYTLESKENYKIGETNAEKLTLILNEVELEDFDPSGIL